MRVGQIVLIAALVSAGCASQSESRNGGPTPPGDGGSPGSGGAGTGGASGSGGSGGASAGTGGTSTTGGASGSAGSAGAGSGGMGGDTTPPDAGQPTMPPPMTGGRALLITGTIPIVGTDVQFEAALKARGLTVEIIQEKLATPAQAEGARVIMLSYGMSSPAFKAEPFTDVPVPIIVTEHFLLPRLKMATPNGFTGKMTKLTFVSDHELAAGFPKGDLEVYSPAQEFFWGTPPATAIRIAHLVGSPDKVTYFAYDKGMVMDGAVAPAKRVQFFHASHSPDPVDKNLYLNANGLKLLGATIDWCLK